MAKTLRELVQEQAALDAFGREIPDPKPMSIPSGFKRPETLAEQVQRLVRTQISRQAAEEGYETFEDSEDFDIDDDMFDPSSPYEEVFDPVLGRAITQDEFRRNEQVYRERFLQAEEAAYKQMEISDALRARPKRGAGVSPAPAQKAPKQPVQEEDEA